MHKFNTDDYKKLSEKEKQKLQQEFHESDLHYFASTAFEAEMMQVDDIKAIHKIIDQRISGGKIGFNLNFFVALTVGAFIGTTIFFIWNRTIKAPHTNGMALTDSVKLKRTTEVTLQAPEMIEKKEELVPIEHFSTIQSKTLSILSGPMEDMNLKEITSIEINKDASEREGLISYIPNASVMFIHQLKVANYKNYYFKNNRNIDVRTNDVSAQFSNREEQLAEELNKRLQDRDYYAHEIIKDAMQAFNKKQFSVCIELLELLEHYNKADVNAQFYLGMSYYYSGNYQKSMAWLSAAMENDVNIFLQEAEFYSALCLKKAGKTNEANEQLKKIESQKLFYAERASEELNGGL